jgi:phytoene dehydrogenase-like protein
VTEEFHPGFRNSVASYTVSLLNPKVIRDLRLAKHGLRVVERPYANFLPLAGWRSFRLGGEHTPARSRSSHGAMPRACRLHAMLDRVVAVLRELHAPHAAERRRTLRLRRLAQSYAVAKRLKRLDLRGRRDLLDLFTKSAGELLDHWFEGEPLKAVLGWDSVVGNFASPYTPGSAYVLLHHVFGEVNGKTGVWGHAIGGMGAITQAMRKECEARGVAIDTDAEVAKLIVKHEKAVGVIWPMAANCARPPWSATSTRSCCTRNWSSAEQPGRRHRAAHRTLSLRLGTFRMNVALSELPDFTAMPGTQLQPHHQSGILIGPSLQYFEQAYFDAKSKAHNAGWARKPIVEVVISSTLDDTLAPPASTSPACSASTCTRRSTAAGTRTATPWRN